jgi:uncharacterized membrane protein
MTDLSSSVGLPRQRVTDSPDHHAALAPWLLLGVGLGGLIDGIVFHEILQWHNMLSNAVPPTDVDRIRFNVLADGLFQAAAWILTLLGLLLLWRSVRSGRTTRTSAGAMGGLLGGLGLFNLIEAVVNHHLLGLHNVREVADPSRWNLGFLLLGGVLPLALGALLRQRAVRRPRDRTGVVSSGSTVTDAAPGGNGNDAHLVQLLLPLADEAGRSIGSHTFERVKQELTARFGGLTAYTRSPAEGRWRGVTEERDDVVIFEVMCTELDRAWWHGYRRRLEGLFGQHVIVIRAAAAELL